MLHLGAVVPNLSFAADAHYHHLTDDIIEGGKLQYKDGAIRVPDGAGTWRAPRSRKNSRNTRISIASWAITRTIRIRRGPAGLRSCRTTAGPIPAMTGSRSPVPDTTLNSANREPLRRPEDVRAHTLRIVSDSPVFDMHTHLSPPSFGELSRWGIDNLVTYHYLVAEVMRAADVRPDAFLTDAAAGPGGSDLGRALRPQHPAVGGDARRRRRHVRTGARPLAPGPAPGARVLSRHHAPNSRSTSCSNGHVSQRS